MDFDKLLEPYRDGGTENKPVERTIGTIIDYLINKKGYPLDTVGAAIFTIFFRLDAGLVYKGDGSYGSKGRELVTSIRMLCDEYTRTKLTAVSNALFLEQFGENLKSILTPKSKKQKLMGWWKGVSV